MGEREMGEREMGEREDEQKPLFETKEGKGRAAFKLFSFSIFVGICSIYVYRVTQILEQDKKGRWAEILMFGAEFWFGFYWILTLAHRWKPVYRSTFKDRLAQRYGEEGVPGVDIFVCTADPKIEPPLMVINTVLSMMAYNYPTEKLNVYVSDDGGSDLTFYALLEASDFSKHWIPFCKKFHTEPRSPAAYFSMKAGPLGLIKDEEYLSIKRLYEEMKHRIEGATKFGTVSKEIQTTHKGFSHWGSTSTSNNHDSIVQILIDGRTRDPNVVDLHGNVLPTLVYMAREKRPNYNHNFKAGAMNSLIRVSSKISNSQIILNVDCDMYSNNSEAIRDALCFFMDQQKGHEIAFVQFPQNFDNITQNDLYGSSLLQISEIDFTGLDGYGGPLYVGSGCFHRRETLCGMKYNKDYRCNWNPRVEEKVEESLAELEETSKVITRCIFEENTQWGKEIGLKYGCPVEDVLTGLSIKCRGWKSIYFNPTQKAFLGTAPTTLAMCLVQHKRWSEGDFQIFLSGYNPLIYGHGKIKLGLQLSYCVYCLWVPNCLPTLCYLVIPPICLLKGIPIFPSISSLWILPFIYVFVAAYAYSVGEFLWSGGTLRGWWNEQRMWLYKRSSSYIFAFMDTLTKLVGLSKLRFDITVKVVEDDVFSRFEKEMMEFGTSSSMFTLLAGLALFNLFSFLEKLTRMVMEKETRVLGSFLLQIFLCGLVILVNLPLYQGLFFRKDKGRMPTALTFKSMILAGLACILSLY